MTDVEYLVEKRLSHSAVDLVTCNRFYHDRDEEIETARVQVLTLLEDKLKEISAGDAKQTESCSIAGRTGSGC
ncbi:hypothetical protein YTPLAS18_34230 [Nitrospira sp.]|nr:hypothetical protein YTPLAS18_34230 [Nitrospira sp.]